MIQAMRLARFILLLPLAALSLSMSGCFLIYRPDIKQGNIIKLDQVAAIRPGMTPEQVVAILGNPVLENVFAPNQMVYVYTIQPGHGDYQAEQLRIFFENGHVTRYTSNIRILPGMDL
ncbi:MAG: outer membrane protein assembly factor BamE [Proteobacteria bacterium]|nr:outer membrane protein assembly factor BamE [Pseudomonadota bacterium]